MKWHKDTNIGAVFNQIHENCAFSESGQNICYYRSAGRDSDFSIPYLCQIGCCNHGCCTVADLAARSNSFGWAIALLSIVLITIILAVVAITVVYFMNRRKDKVLKNAIVYGGGSSSASQVRSYIGYLIHPNFFL
ncbi:unnamed protein product [Haemonchus placei]|uniref:CX domain-containing protein n=1 Tax=Haemonchus placei TaxID=6290 RepID=A0A3P7X6T0_HAEPC|nr:unnamed protein product [Haemonchus placei]